MDRVVYKCETCGHGFPLEDGKRVYFDGEPWTACPNCGSASLEEAAICDHCGEIVFPWLLESGLCPDCQEEAKKAFRDAWEGLDEWVREFLEDGYIEINFN